MCNFIHYLPDGEMKNVLFDVISFRYSLRNFKNLIYKFVAQENWHAYKQVEFMIIGKDWCKDNGMDYSEIN